MGPFVTVEHFPPHCVHPRNQPQIPQVQQQYLDWNQQQQQQQQKLIGTSNCCEPPPATTTSTTVSSSSFEEDTTSCSIDENVEVIHSTNSIDCEDLQLLVPGGIQYSSNSRYQHHHQHSNSSTTIITTSSIIQNNSNSSNKDKNIMSLLQLDRYGFIVNIDSKGHVVETYGDESIKVPTFAEAQRIERREKKWTTTLQHWNNTNNGKKQDQTSHSKQSRNRKSKRPSLTSSHPIKSSPIPYKLLKKRLRKGIPDSVRGRVWSALGGGIQVPGLYQDIVTKTSDAMLETYREQMMNGTMMNDPLKLQDYDNAAADIDHETDTSTATATNDSNRTSPTTASEISSYNNQSPATSKKKGKDNKAKTETSQPANNENFATTRNFRCIQDTIERDIHRTYPRHNLFYEEDRHKIHSADVAAESSLSASTTNNASDILATTTSGLVCDPELASLILNLESDIRIATSGNKASNGNQYDNPTNDNTMTPSVPGGQAALRRVLRAYSYYDPDVGYCQGMNFIAGMFLTFMSEEEAFWLLVAVMNNKPCKMRGMFGEGMRETHKVLHVAEKLIHHHLPRLARHFDKEHIHVTMYATQWLLTGYTSSFHFDLVFRVWDAFLGEGWKIIYRVMLALLQKYQSQLMKMSFEEILTFFRELPDRVEGYQIMDIASKIQLRKRVIARYENEWDKQNSNASGSS